MHGDLAVFGFVLLISGVIYLPAYLFGKKKHTPIKVISLIEHKRRRKQLKRC